MSSNPTVLSFPERVEKAAKAAKVDKDKLLTALAEIGIEPEDDDALEVVRVFGSSELEEVFKKAEAKPARAAMGVDVLIRLDEAEQAEADKPAEQPKSDVEKFIEATKPVEQWSDVDLIAAYGVDCEDRIAEALDKKGKERAFIVFDEDGNVDQETTLELLRVARRQDTPKQYNNKSGKLKSVYRVGEFPMTYVEESPLFEDVILVNGFCQESSVSWKDIADEDRVIVRVAHETVGLDDDHFSVQQLVDKIKNGLPGSGAKFLLTGPVELAYNELQEDNRLPRLRRKYSTRKGNGDPFYVRTSGHRSH